MSEDHKPTNELERERVLKAGGKVTEEGRIDGNLNLSRSLGDLDYKNNPDLPPEEQKITANPDIKIETLQENDEFMVQACDGIWEIIDRQQIIDYIKKHLGDKSLTEINASILKNCLGKR